MQKISSEMPKKNHTFVLSDDSVNSYGYRVLLSGMDTSRFEKNPVMFYSHNYGLLPIGYWENVRVEEGRLMAEAKFDEGDPFALEIKRKVEAGVIRCSSIGFNINEIDDAESLKLSGQRGPTVTKSELMEGSICAVGSNRNAMRLSEHTDENGEPLKVGSRMTLTMVQGKEPQDINPLNSSSMTEQERQQMEQLQSQVATLTNERNTLTQERDEARQELQRVRDAEIETLLNAAVSDGRINETDKPAWKEMLKLTPENAKNALAKLNTRTSLSQMLEQNRGKGEFAGKSWDELDRAGKLSAFKAADPEAFKALYRETFGAEYKE